jgi:hypothetical protein
MNLSSLSKLYKKVHEHIEQQTFSFIGDVVFSYLIKKEHNNLVFKPYAPRNANSYGMEYDRNYTAKYSFAYHPVQLKQWSIYREDLLCVVKQCYKRHLLAIMYKKMGNIDIIYWKKTITARAIRVDKEVAREGTVEVVMNIIIITNPITLVVM